MTWLALSFSYRIILIVVFRGSHVLYVVFFFFFKQKTAYEMRISDWSSDVCSSDLCAASPARAGSHPATPRAGGLRRSSRAFHSRHAMPAGGRPASAKDRISARVACLCSG